MPQRVPPARRMKRHASLVPLSREHHHGLVMARRLILGRSTNPRADWPPERSGQVQRLLEFFETELRAHFEVEEAHVFPTAARELTGGDRQTRELIAEHHTMRAMIRDFETDPASCLDERLIAFGKLLEAHIHREERELFQQMQAECRPETMDALGAGIGASAGATGVPSCRL